MGCRSPTPCPPLDHGYTPADDFAISAELTRAIGVPALVMTSYNLAWHFRGTERVDDFARADIVRPAPARGRRGEHRARVRDKELAAGVRRR